MPASTSGDDSHCCDEYRAILWYFECRLYVRDALSKNAKIKDETINFLCDFYKL